MRGRSNGGAAGFMVGTKTTPIPVQRTTRLSAQRVLTSMNAGKMTPLAVIPLLREDAITRANFRVAFEMDETVELLMNAVNVRVMAYCVPKLAFERFDGLDSINRSYEGQNQSDGDPSPAWFDVQTVDASFRNNPIYTALGKHARVGTNINTEYVEAYNCIWNFRAANRSQDIALRGRLDTSLAPAFWNHQTFAHVVPDFDQALIDGEVPLNVTSLRANIRGIGIAETPSPGVAASRVSRETGDVGNPITYPQGWSIQGASATMGGGDAALVVKANSTSGYPDIWAELEQNGITVSLSNIDMARKTQAFAALRRQYSGLSDDYIVDLLMDGISIPDQQMKQPMLLADVSTVFGMSKRYASDGASLTESVVNGATMVDLRFTVPRLNTGGIVMIVAEIAPEQLFERQRDVYMHSESVSALPQFLRDTLDPEKVEVVRNEYVDVDHDTPTATFGYAPLNHMWAKSIPQVGGKFYRPEVDGAFDEDRQRIWAVETANPVLSQDFYLVSQMNYKPFVVTDPSIDHFEVLLRGEAVIRGNTVFGGLLVEATDDYAEVLAEAPQDRIEKPLTTETLPASDEPAE